MPMELTESSLQLLKVGLMVGVPSFFAGWFAHGLWGWLAFSSGKDRS